MLKIVRPEHFRVALNGSRTLKDQARCFSSFRNYHHSETQQFPRRLHTPFILPQHRKVSFQSTIESLVKTQTGIFKSISESTPVEWAQNLLLTIHETTCLPWWATIVCTTVLLRGTVTLPLAAYQHYILAKLENLSIEMPDLVEELKKETGMAVRLYSLDEKTARFLYNKSLRKQWNNLIVRDNCHPLKASLLLWFQIPMWISLSVSLRNLVYMLPHQDRAAEITFTELSVGGFGFIPNLTDVDGSWILPATLCVVNLLIIELQVLSRIQPPSKLHQYLTNLFRGFSIFLVPIAASVPSCLVLYWTTSSTVGLIQNLLLMSPRVRRLLRIPQTPSEIGNPYQNVLNGIKRKLRIA